MRAPDLTARAKLTLLFTSLFAVGGAGVVVATYLLVERNLSPTTIRSPATDPNFLTACAGSGVGPSANLAQKCASTFSNGVIATAQIQRDSVLSSLLWTSSAVLLVSIVAVAIVAWLLAGRILRPVRTITEAARNASDGNLSERLRLPGRDDELKHLGDTFDLMLDRLETSFRSQQQFVANASHELRTPLTMMATTIDVALAKSSITRTDLLRMATEVRGSVDEANALVRALLELARSDAAVLTRRTEDLADIVNDAITATNFGEIRVCSSLEPAHIGGDRTLLVALVKNLLNNATKYNILHGSIDLFTYQEPTDAVLRIVNTGRAIPEAEAEALFGRFTRLDSRIDENGYGLGLALVRSVAEAHAGKVEALPGPQGGLEVVVRIPSPSARPVDIS